MRSLRGQLLVAVPGLPDQNFWRTVVLMIRHDEDGGFGLILNRPTSRTVAEIWNLIAKKPCDCDQTVHLGGPVPGTVLALHTMRSCSEDEILPGVYLATRLERLNRIVRHPDRPFRLYAGYSGWAAGQLEGELEQGGWLTLEASYDYVFGDPDTLWKKAAEAVGQQIVEPLLTRVRTPADPSQN